MDKARKDYRYAELDGIECYEGNCNMKVVGSNGTESKWLSITETELADIRDMLAGDAAEVAFRILDREGYSYVAYGPEDVHDALNSYAEDGDVDTVTHRDEITRHVMEGDGWGDIAYGFESGIFDVIQGTHHDHPEWFPEVDTPTPVGLVATPALVAEYVKFVVGSEPGDRFARVTAELRNRGVIE